MMLDLSATQAWGTLALGSLVSYKSGLLFRMNVEKRLTSVFQLVYSTFKQWEPDRPFYLVLLLIFVPSLMVPMMRYQFANIVTATLSTFSVYYSLIALLAALYRLSPLHPLAKYPGPILNKLSKLRMTWESSKGKQHLYYSELHKIYGDIVRVGEGYPYSRLARTHN